MRNFSVLLAMVVTASVAVAAPDVSNIYRYDEFTNGGFGNSGGAFRFRTVAASGGSATWSNVGYGNGVRFWTFCSERTTVGINSSGYATIDSEIYYDGSGPIDLYSSSDTADVRDVFARYAGAGGSDAGLIALGFTVTNSTQRGTANRAVQAYIWKNLGYSIADISSSLSASDESMLDAISDVNRNHVRALNLWFRRSSGGSEVSWATFQNDILINRSGTDKQSQLILVVPVPGAALLGVLGLGIAGWMKRRMA